MKFSKAKVVFILIFFWGYVVHLEAQLYNKIFQQNDSLMQDSTHSLYFNLETLNFLRNTEYFDMIEKGQTLFGHLLQPSLSFQPYPNVLVNAGVQLRQDYGSTNLQTVQPLFFVSLFNKKWRYNFGRLQGTTNYNLIEPMYNIDRAITNRIENGFQSIYTSKKFYFNNFLVWNEPTYRTTHNQERFFTGLSTRTTILNGKMWQLDFPLQGTLAHRGGQLNDNPTPIYTRINTALGLQLKWIPKNNFLIRLENYWLNAMDFSPNITQPYKNGNASWHTLSFEFNNVQLMFNYWAGREFQSPIGSQIYNNYNIYNNEMRQIQHIAFARFLYFKPIYNGLQLDLRFEPFYTLEYNKFQYSYSVYLKWNFRERLFSLRK